ncbi:hypothetical protein HAX54_053156 [Datura stramonium]|uniref:Uncharacterized protein n=1 Tax=Datura stramonium TaxID=4076 RepID=A0ABS8SZX3_DATST|nr:hypothetical protein [Datura stramonium]
MSPDKITLAVRSVGMNAYELLQTQSVQTRSQGRLSVQATHMSTPSLTEGPMRIPTLYTPPLSSSNTDVRGAIQMLTQIVAVQSQCQGTLP